jgi:hypothetical protein
VRGCIREARRGEGRERWPNGERGAKNGAKNGGMVGECGEWWNGGRMRRMVEWWENAENGGRMKRDRETIPFKREKVNIRMVTR